MLMGVHHTREREPPAPIDHGGRVVVRQIGGDPDDGAVVDGDVPKFGRGDIGTDHRTFFSSSSVVAMHVSLPPRHGCSAKGNIRSI